MGTQGVILLIVALGALGALLVGGVMLMLYYRAGREDEWYVDEEPVVYGNLIQCPTCNYMNPIDTAACLNCRQPLPRPRDYPPVAPPPSPAFQNEYAYRPSVQLAGAIDYSRAGDMTVQASAAGHHASAPPPAPVPPPPAPEPSTGRVWIGGVAGPANGERYALTQTDTMVGRSTSCDVQIADPKVSRKHFLIRYANEGYFLQDQQSSRGTLINGQRVMAQRLKDGDSITLGDSTLIFHID